MIYSVHDQIRGDFVYFEGPDRIPINDDQPVPSFAPDLVGKLGIAASDAGRPLPADAVPVGRGPLPKGKVSTGEVGSEKSGTFLGPSPDGIGSLESGDLTPAEHQEVKHMLAFGGALCGFIIAYGGWRLLPRGKR